MSDLTCIFSKNSYSILLKPHTCPNTLLELDSPQNSVLVQDNVLTGGGYLISIDGTWSAELFPCFSMW